MANVCGARHREPRRRRARGAGRCHRVNRSGTCRCNGSPLVAPRDSLRRVLVEVADSGTVDLDEVASPPGAAISPTRHTPARATGRSADGPTPRIARASGPTSTSSLVEVNGHFWPGKPSSNGARQCALPMVGSPRCSDGSPTRRCRRCARRIEPLGGAAVVLPRPLGVDPPTLLAPRGRSAPFRAPDRHVRDGALRRPRPDAVRRDRVRVDVRDDVRRRRPRDCCSSASGSGRAPGQGLLGRFRAAWALAVAAGVVATGVRHRVRRGVRADARACPRCGSSRSTIRCGSSSPASSWAPCCSAISQVIGTVNRWREGGARFALYDPCGVAGSVSYVGLGLLGVGRVRARERASTVAGGVLVAIGIALVFVGGFVAAGGRGAGVAQATVESFDGRRAARLERRVVRPARRVRARARRDRLGRVGRHDRAVAARTSPPSAAVVALRRRQPRRVRARGARRRRPGAAARVLRAVLAHVRRGRPSVPSRGTSRRRARCRSTIDEMKETSWVSG